MSAAKPFFDITTHRSPAQHVREYRHGVADEASDYVIVAKQYVPIFERPAQEGDLTVVACAGIGMVKELYEPLFEEIARRCVAQDVHIRAFWIADMACVGDSALLNKENLTNEQNWFDHSRDLLVMINNQRKLMPRPLVGLGHSMGAAQVAYLASLHPNLFHSLILIEPSIHQGLEQKTSFLMSKAMTRRRETWPTHAEAVRGINKNQFYKIWDRRCVDLLIEHNFTLVGGDGQTVATKTPRSMEVALMLRANLHGIGKRGLEQMSATDRAAFPDLDPGKAMLSPWYCPEPFAVLQILPALRPGVCYILGGSSAHANDDVRKVRLETTGTGVGGSGGARFGRVVEHVVPDGGHYLVFDREHLPIVSDKAAGWLVLEMKRWRDQCEEDSQWARKSPKERSDPHPIIVDALSQWHPSKNQDLEKIVQSKL